MKSVVLMNGAEAASPTMNATSAFAAERQLPEVEQRSSVDRPDGPPVDEDDRRDGSDPVAEEQQVALEGCGQIAGVQDQRQDERGGGDDRGRHRPGECSRPPPEGTATRCSRS